MTPLIFLKSPFYKCSISVFLIAGFLLGCTSLSKTSVNNSGAGLVGTWRVVSATLFVGNDAAGRLFYGSRPEGRLTFDEYGNYSLIAIDSDSLNRNMPFRIPDRERGTDEENRRVVHASIANFGTYSITRGASGQSDSLVLNIASATFPNWTGIRQPRKIISLTADTLKYEVNPASSGGGSTRGIAIFVWARMK